MADESGTPFVLLELAWASPPERAWGRHRQFRVAPGRDLVVADASVLPAPQRDELRRYAGERASIVDVSDAWHRFRMSAPAGRQCVARGCSIDLDGDGGARCLAGTGSRAWVTRFAGVPAMLLLHTGAGQSQRLDLFVARSYAQWTSRRLDEGALP